MARPLTYLGALAVLILVSGVVTAMVARRAPKPPTIGRLALSPCAQSPNCVTSVAEPHRIAPFAFGDRTPDEAMARLRAVLIATPRVTLVRDEANYLHAEVRSAVFGFIDDVEVSIANDALQIRSASRTGYSDLGVNRARVERLRQAYQER